MSNDIQINVTLNDATGPQKAKIKADLEAWAETLAPVTVTATNPVDDTWRAEVDAGIKEAAGEPVDVAFGANTEELQAAMEETFAAIRSAAAEPLAIGPANVDEFQASALEAIASVRAEIEAALEAPLPPIYATATILDQQSSGNGQLALPAGSSPLALPAGSGSPQSSGPLFGGGEDPYAAAAQRISDLAPIEIPVRAANPIDDAWLAQVKSSIRSIANDALSIPVNPELEGFQAQLEALLAELSTTTHADIPVDVGDGMIFREQVANLVQQVEDSIHAVIDVQISNEGALTDLQAKTVAASQATLDLVAAQDKLNQATAAGSDDQIAKARNDVVAATKAEAEASGELDAAMTAAAESEAIAGDVAKTTTSSMRGLNDAMGPLWMVMNVAQIAMFAFGSGSSSAATGAQDLSQQLIALGKDGANAASSLSGNGGLSSLNDDLVKINQSSAQFSAAFSGSLQMAKGYVDNLTTSQNELGASMITAADGAGKTAQQIGDLRQAAATSGKAVDDTTNSVKQWAAEIANGSISEKTLPQNIQDAVDRYNAFGRVLGQAQKAYQDERAAQALVTADLRQQGIVLTDAEQGWNAIGGAVSNTVSEFNTATAGIKSLADNQVAAAAANLQARDQFQQLREAVATTADAVVSANHGIVTSEEGAAAAQLSYVGALNQEATAQQAVANARLAAAQNLTNLQLQTNDAAAGTLNAGVNLFDATTSAASLGVNTSNAHAVASQTVTSSNEAQVKAAIALIEAQNQLADSQNSAAQSQGSLNTAQSQGIAGNQGVVSAQQALANATNQVTTAQQGMQNAQFSVSQSEQAARQAAQAHAQALDAASTSTDINTDAGNRNWQMLESLFEKNFTATGSVQQATSATEIEGEKMGFTADQIDGMIGQITRIPPNTNFSIVGTPSLNLQTLLQQAQAQGINPYSLGLDNSQGQVDMARGPIGGSYAQGGPIGGAGGPTEDNQLIWASSGEHMWTADEVQAAGGHGAVESMRQAVKGYAGGGAITPQQAMGINFRLAGWDGVLQGTSFGLQAMGADTPNLPRGTGTVDFGTYGAPATSAPTGKGLSSSRAQNEAIMQQVFASMFGWTGQQWADAYTLEMMEAGFNNTAQNPTSTAYGLGQFLDGTWASYGIPKTSDPTLQSEAMGRYIQARYGSPAGALSHEHAFHWYAAGGPANGLTGIGDQGPEAVWLPNGSTVMPAANTQALAMAAAAPSIADIQVTFGGNVNNGFATLIMQLVRTGQIQLNVNGQAVRTG